MRTAQGVGHTAELNGTGQRSLEPGEVGKRRQSFALCRPRFKQERESLCSFLSTAAISQSVCPRRQQRLQAAQSRSSPSCWAGPGPEPEAEPVADRVSPSLSLLEPPRPARCPHPSLDAAVPSSHAQSVSDLEPASSFFLEHPDLSAEELCPLNLLNVRPPSSEGPCWPPDWSNLPPSCPPFGPSMLLDRHRGPSRPERKAEGLHPSSLKEQKEEPRLQNLSMMPTRPSRVFQDIVLNTRQNLEHVRHSKTGSEGTAIRVLANHFRVWHPRWPVFKYNVRFQPDVKGARLRAELLFQSERVFGRRRIFDGQSLLSPERLRVSSLELVRQTQDGDIVHITVEFFKELKPTHPDYLRYYNVLFRRTLKLINLEQVGRHYYSQEAEEEFRSWGLDVRSGYITSILPYEHSLTLCADVSYRVLQSKTAYDVIDGTYEFLRGYPATSSRQLQQELKDRVAKQLLGSVVLTKYNNRTYRVDGINWDQNPRDTFTRSDGTRVTFVEYYLQQYNEQVTELKQPLLVSLGRWRKGQRDAPREPVLLVPQLCYLTGLPRFLPSSTMKKLVERTRPNANDRVNILKIFIEGLESDQNVQEELERWELRFGSDFMPVSGRVLREVTIFQHDKSESSEGHASHGYGYDKSKSHVSPLFVFKVVCILPSDDQKRYADIKRYLCVQCPVPSQCVVAETLSSPKRFLTIVTKIAQQMNCKMGGALWKVETGLQRTMFIGIDCFHDVVHRRKSIAGFVASTDEDLTTWYSQCIFQETGEELVDGLTGCLEAALTSWFKNALSAPQSIVVYRDGVGDGQLQALLDHELPQLVRYLKHACRHSIKLAFIVVKKRINTRFFIEKNGLYHNPPSGTVIDVVLTREEWYDFYIVSQSSRSGMVTPTHYNVIYDTIRLTPDAVQRLTYKLCHMYYNLPGIIRVPAPCHYAHKLAYLVGKSLRQEPSRSLSHTLYYL
ncbi:piwi-like protein 3 [Castor canadensis]|uniref:Piwi-like protein 3 n=1 Tax=Castor canadensis TaxID=51338 RepID=A0A8B7WFS7_CASCN